MVCGARVECTLRSPARRTLVRRTNRTSRYGIGVFGIENAEFSSVVAVLGARNPHFLRGFLDMFRRCVRGADVGIANALVIE